jgi:hypothetical protein
MPGAEVRDSTGGGLTPTQSQLMAPAYYQAYRCCVVDASQRFIDWIPNTKWEFMPTGTAILEADSDVTPITGDPDDGDYLAVDNVLMPVGALPGDLDNDGTLEPHDAVTNVRAIIFKPNGMIPSIQKFVTIGEGSFVSGRWIVRNRKNMRDIRVDQYTGRITVQ